MRSIFLNAVCVLFALNNNTFLYFMVRFFSVLSECFILLREVFFFSTFSSQGHLKKSFTIFFTYSKHIRNEGWLPYNYL